MGWWEDFIQNLGRSNGGQGGGVNTNPGASVNNYNSGRKPLDLSDHMKVRKPLDLSKHMTNQPPAPISNIGQGALSGAALGISVIPEVEPPVYGRSLADFMEGVNLQEVPNFGKTLQDYLGMGQYQYQNIAKEQLAELASQEAKYKQRGKEGGEAIGSIYDQLGTAIQENNASSQAAYTGAIDASTEQSSNLMDSVMSARGDQKAQEQAVMNNVLGDLAGSVSLQSQNDSATAHANQTGHIASSGLNNTDYLRRMQSANADYGESQVNGAGFAGAEAQSALMSDVLNAIAQVDTNRVNVIADAKNQGRANAVQHYGIDYDQFNQDRNAILQGNDSAMSGAQAQYEADYQKWQDQRDWETGASQWANEFNANQSNLSAENQRQQESGGSIKSYDQAQQQRQAILTDFASSIGMDYNSPEFQSIANVVVNRAGQDVGTSQNKGNDAPSSWETSIVAELQNAYGLSEEQAKMLLGYQPELYNTYQR